MKNQMNKQKGFTLIELIIVIVILGILAVTAAPRFIDLQSDAREKTLQGVKAALQGASQLVYAKAAISGVQNGDGQVVIVKGATAATNTTVDTTNGYPDAIELTAFADLAPFLDLSDADFDFAKTAATDDNFEITFQGQLEAGNCFIRYTNAAANASPAIVVVATGC